MQIRSISRLRPGWFALLLGVGCFHALPAVAGEAPAGLGSGVSVGGSSTLSPSAAPIGSGEVVAPASDSVSFDPVTGELLLTAAAQSSLDQTGSQLLQTLQSQNPELAEIMTSSGGITSSQAAESAAAAIANGESTAVAISDGTLVIDAPSDSFNVPNGISTTATFTPESGLPVTITLEGTADQVSNAAAFLATAAIAGFAPEQVSLFTGFALQGIPYTDLVALFNSLTGLLAGVGATGEESDEAADVDAALLNQAIQAYNSILDSSNLETLQSLSTDSDFLLIGQSLSQLRNAIEV